MEVDSGSDGFHMHQGNFRQYGHQEVLVKMYFLAMFELSEGVDLLRIITQVMGGYTYIIYICIGYYIYTYRIYIYAVYISYIYIFTVTCVMGRSIFFVAQQGSRFMDDCQLLEMVGVSMIFPATLGMGKLNKNCNATGNRPPLFKYIEYTGWILYGVTWTKRQSCYK